MAEGTDRVIATAPATPPAPLNQVAAEAIEAAKAYARPAKKKFCLDQT